MFVGTRMRYCLSEIYMGSYMIRTYLRIPFSNRLENVKTVNVLRLMFDSRRFVR